MTDDLLVAAVERSENGLLDLDDWADFITLTAQQGVGVGAVLIAATLATVSAVAMHRDGLTIESIVSVTGLPHRDVEGGLKELCELGLVELFEVELDDGAVVGMYVPAAASAADPFNYPDHWGADDDVDA